MPSELSALSNSSPPSDICWENNGHYYHQNVTKISQNSAELSRRGKRESPGLLLELGERRGEGAREKGCSPPGQLQQRRQLRALANTMHPLWPWPRCSRLFMRSAIWGHVSKCGVLWSTRCMQTVIFMGNESDLHVFIQSHLNSQSQALNKIIAPFASSNSDAPLLRKPYLPPLHTGIPVFRASSHTS